MLYKAEYCIAKPIWNDQNDGRNLSTMDDHLHIQSTLVISNSKGLSEILRDIRSSTYQVCRIEEKII